MSECEEPPVDERMVSRNDLNSVFTRFMFFSNSEYIDFNTANSAIRLASVFEDRDA